jgi:hypothetical protein
MSGVLMFLCQLRARRQIGLKLRSQAAAESFETLFEVESFPHGDTLAYLSSKLDVSEMAGIPADMAEGLIRKKVFEKSKLLGNYYRIAIDGTGTFRFKSRHCDECLTTTHRNGETHYYHNVLEAKLVTPEGFCISVMTEFIENKEAHITIGSDSKSKQDCELKAFHRLAEKLKKRFKRLPICLLLDALYANHPVFEVCRKNGWAFLITLKDEQFKTINDEFGRLLKLHPENQHTRKTKDEKTKKKDITQNFTWMNDLMYIDVDQQTNYVNVIECNEFKPGKDKQGNEVRLKTKFKWLSNLHVTKNNLIDLSNNGGRQRWKIENEGINVQKNGGYGLKHAYCREPNAFKIIYVLMQIAHTIAQLIQRGSLLKKFFPRGPGSHGNLAFLLLEGLRSLRITPQFMDAINASRVQIRFDTS